MRTQLSDRNIANEFLAVIANGWLCSDYERASREIGVFGPQPVSGERERLLVKWGEIDGEIEFKTEDRERSLDQFSVMFLHPLAQTMAAYVFPAPKNEDR